MAVTKRTRFEVLRRDHYTCRYCRSTDKPLTIDHVTPVALGGSDAPENLVAACQDCNAGKGSAAPDAALVADVEDDALRWATARKIAAAKVAAHRKRHRAAHSKFKKLWADWDSDLDHLPEDWTRSLDQWLDLGITYAQIEEAYWITMGKRHVRSQTVFRYMAGVIRNWLIDIEEATRAILDGEGDE